MYVTPETLRSIPVFYGGGLVPSEQGPSYESIPVDGWLFSDHWVYGESQVRTGLSLPSEPQVRTAKQRA